MKIALGMPTVDSVAGELLSDHLRLAGEVARTCETLFVCPVGVVPHDRARMMIVEQALKERCDLVFFVDADTSIPKGGFKKLLDTLSRTTAQVVTGHYYRRGYPYTCVWSKRQNGKFSQVDATSGIHELDTCGLGCALVDLKWVHQRLEKPYFVCLQNEGGTFVTDDITFCDKVTEAGGLIVGDASIRCGHLHHRVMIQDKNVVALRKAELIEELEELNHAG